jgi:hypothetical protein
MVGVVLLGTYSPLHIPIYYPWWLILGSVFRRFNIVAILAIDRIEHSGFSTVSSILQPVAKAAPGLAFEMG